MASSLFRKTPISGKLGPLMSANSKSPQKPHIKLSPDARFQRAIVCGAPERAKLISTLMEGSIELAKNREYHSYIGKHKGVEVW